MKGRCIILILAIANVAYGGVTPISEWHHVEGSAGWVEVDSYDQSAAYPISGTAFGLGYYGDDDVVIASSSAGQYVVSASVTGSIFSGSASAASRYVFQPNCDTLKVEIDGATGMYSWDGNQVQYRLTDLTSGGTVFSYSSPTSQDYEVVLVDESHRIGVDPGHEYELFLSADASQGDVSTTHSWLTAEVTCVPAPGAFLLSAIGAAAVGLYRRRCGGRT